MIEPFAKRLAAALGVAAGCLLLPPAAAEAHPAHVAIAEVEWNAETAKLEVALRVRPEDLEQALTRMLGGKQRVTLETTEHVDRHIAAYLRPRFALELDGRRQPLQWVGKEVGARETWLYFEIDAERFPQSAAVLSCTVLMDLQPEQLNLVLLRRGRERVSYDFTRRRPRQRIGE